MKLILAQSVWRPSLGNDIWARDQIRTRKISLLTKKQKIPRPWDSWMAWLVQKEENPVFWDIICKDKGSIRWSWERRQAIDSIGPWKPDKRFSFFQIK